MGTEKSYASRWKRTAKTALLALAVWSVTAAVAVAETPEEAAHDILKEMSAYLGKTKNLTLDFSADVEVISHGGQTALSGLKVQFSSSGTVTVSRPDKIRASRTSSHADFEIISDGKTVTLHGRGANAYAQTEAAPTLDELFDGIRDLTGFEFPGADLLFSDVYGQLSVPIERAAYIGTAIIDGEECHHLAFRTPDVDWQIWVNASDKPIPCKYVVTSKWMAGAPQYQLRISNWNDNPSLNADSFKFAPPEGAVATSVEELEGIGELPVPAAVGGQ